MTKPLNEMTFRPIDGVWRDCSTGAVLADVLQMYDIIVSIWYRATAGKVTLTILKL